MFRMFPILIGLLILSACTVRVGPLPETSSPPSSASSESAKPTEPTQPTKPTEERETHNVTYRGIVQPAGISIYMQGSHRLLLSDGRFLLLESDNVDLNGYVGEEVEVSGSTRPTVEANGIIMRVEKTKLILPISSPAATLPDGQGQESSHVISSEPTAQSSAPAAPASSEPPEAVKPTEGDPALLATVEAMAAENFSAEHWTQEYCSSHIGFCLPVHRNWWYKSFGTTTTTLWHVEVGNSPVLNLGDGPISINLIPGDLSLENQETTNVQVHGDTVVASRPWSGDRHFEIRADSALEAAVRYMIEHITTYEGN